MKKIICIICLLVISCFQSNIVKAENIWGAMAGETIVETPIYLYNIEYSKVLNCHVENMSLVDETTLLDVYALTRDETQQFVFCKTQDGLQIQLEDGIGYVKADEIKEGSLLHCTYQNEGSYWKIVWTNSGARIVCQEDMSLVLSVNSDGSVYLARLGCAAGQYWNIVQVDVIEEETIDEPLVTPVISLDETTNITQIFGVDVRMNATCSGSSTCDDNGFQYEIMGANCETKGMVNGLIGWYDSYQQSLVVIGNTQYSLIYQSGINGIYNFAVYSSIPADISELSRIIFQNDVQRINEYQVQQLMEVTFSTPDIVPQIICQIYGADIYLNWKDEQGWQNKKYSLDLKQESTNDAIGRYRAFGKDYYIYDTKDGTTGICSWDGVQCKTFTEYCVEDVCIIDDKAIFLASSKRDKDKKFYTCTLDKDASLEKWLELSTDYKTHMAYNDHWVYWTVKNGNIICIYRINILTSDKEEVVQIAGVDDVKLIASKDYLFLYPQLNINSNIYFFMDGGLFRSNGANFAIDLSTGEVYLLETNGQFSIEDFAGEIIPDYLLELIETQKSSEAVNQNQEPQMTQSVQEVQPQTTQSVQEVQPLNIIGEYVLSDGYVYNTIIVQISTECNVCFVDATGDNTDGSDYGGGFSGTLTNMGNYEYLYQNEYGETAYFYFSQNHLSVIANSQFGGVGFNGFTGEYNKTVEYMMP